MHPLIQLKRATSLLFIAFLLACFALPQIAQAVVPAPDGGYPGGNTAEGANALFSLTTGRYNTGNGWNSLHTLTSGNFNTGIGAATLFSNTGGGNTAAGTAALFSNTTGDSNTAVGSFALLSNTAGLQNTATGDSALEQNTTGANNTALGASAGLNVTTANNVICIGATVLGANVSNTCFFGNIFGSTSSSGVGVFVNTNGRLGTMTSSRRFKKDIKPLDKASEAVLLLKPVSFRYIREVDPEGTSAVQFGLVAEDVEKVNSDLIVRDKERKPYSVRYDQVNAMLLNEFLKEHKAFVEEQCKVRQQGATIAQHQEQIEALIAGYRK
jgi:hypothetical protein